MREKNLERDGEGWQEVVRKRKKQTFEGRGRVDVATSVWKIQYKDTFSFYFTEFPETHGAKEMLRAFKLYGEAMEVVIPPKRDKWGKRFGFVRFSNVEDPRMFAIKLDNIIFGAKKINVNIPRFQREWNGASKLQQPQRQNAGVQRGGPLKVQHNQTQGEVQKFRQVWRKKNVDGVGGRRWERQDVQNQWKENHSANGPKIIYHRKNNTAEVCYNVPEEEVQKFQKMYIGTVRTPGSTYYVQEWFNMQGFFLIKITPLGANKVLMEEMEEGVISGLMKEYKDWLHEKFEDIRGWDPEVVDNERIVWIRCHGVPTHAWKDDFFASLARNFGEYLGMDESTRTKSAMDVARIRIRSNGYDVFNAVVTANINNSLFHIKMTEEWCGPLQWIENSCKRCCRKNVDSGDSSDSEDEHGDVPPLFSVEDEWCNDGGEEEEGDPEKEEEGVKENDEGSFVQETIGVFDESQNNDCTKNGEEVQSFNEVMGKGNEVSGVVEKIEEVRERLEREVVELPHVSIIAGGGGTQLNKTCVNVENVEGNHVEDGSSKEGGARINGGKCWRRG